MSTIHDHACAILAQHFIGDWATPREIDSLAGHVQSAVEEWLSDNKPEHSAEVDDWFSDTGNESNEPPVPEPDDFEGEMRRLDREA